MHDWLFEPNTLDWTQIVLKNKNTNLAQALSGSISHSNKQCVVISFNWRSWLAETFPLFFKVSNGWIKNRANINIIKCEKKKGCEYFIHFYLLLFRVAAGRSQSQQSSGECGVHPPLSTSPSQGHTWRPTTTDHHIHNNGHFKVNTNPVLHFSSGWTHLSQLLWSIISN